MRCRAKNRVNIIVDSLAWARDHPETIHLHLDTRQARHGHMPKSRRVLESSRSGHPVQLRQAFELCAQARVHA
jgi:hypothetical protein